MSMSKESLSLLSRCDLVKEMAALLMNLNTTDQVHIWRAVGALMGLDRRGADEGE